MSSLKKKRKRPPDFSLYSSRTSISDLKKISDKKHPASWWSKLGKHLKRVGAEADVIKYTRQRFYLHPEGFYDYLYDIMGFKDLYEPLHRPICEFITKSSEKDSNKFKLLLAFRGSFKSSIITIGYSTWRIAKEYLETGKSTIRVLVACEVMALGLKFVRNIKQVLQWNDSYRMLFGSHKGDRNWTEVNLISQHRGDSIVAEPTVSAVAIDADRTGFHYDLIICDDLEAERSSATKMQIEKVWTFYRLLFSLLDPGKDLIVLGTRWHYADIYARIQEENKTSKRFKVMIIPCMDKRTGELAFPTRFDARMLNQLKEQQGNYIFSCQYLLNPVPDENRIFKKAWIKFVDDINLEDKKLNYFISADMAYTEQYRIFSGEAKKADYTVIMTVGIDARMNIYVIKTFRQRCSRLEAIKEMFKQYYDKKACIIALQKWDRVLIDEAIKEYAFEYGKLPLVQYVSYPSKESDKAERIKTNLQPKFESGRVYISRNDLWLKEELLDFPSGTYDDGLDALCNISKVMAPPPDSGGLGKVFTPIQKHIRALQLGTFEPDEDNEDIWETL